jgi:formylglycine-generating enzyme required for sulfatase activity
MTTQEAAIELERMVLIKGGKFLMGSENFYPEEKPVREVTVDGFYMDKYEVTNEDYKKFVDETGYITVAERPLNPADFPGAKPEFIVPGALVFQKSKGPVNLNDYFNWWAYVPGACWKNPKGPDSSLNNREKYPVVHIAYEDAEAYAKWSEKDLPTEAEWEFAARGGLDGKNFTWGDEDVQFIKPMANTWQGEFPWQNLLIDEYEGTSPVGSFAPNGYGLYDMAGNVWEWTCDWYLRNLTGSEAEKQNRAVRLRNQDYSEGVRWCGLIKIEEIIKGGSHLCAPNYCLRYRPAARQPQMIDTGMNHLGFVKRLK